MAAKVLLVDDDRDPQGTVREILKSSGYFVVRAADCEHAFALLGRERFDLLLLDITLPDKSGFRVLEFVEENHVSCKVIVITGSGAQGQAIKSGTRGERQYIRRPYSPDHLRKSIEHVLSEHSHEQLKLQIINVADFIKRTPAGDLDMRASKQVLAEIAATGTGLRDYTVLIDLRAVTTRMSTTDIYELGSELVQYGETFRRKTAVLAPHEENRAQGSFSGTASPHQGSRVRAFTEFEDALFWLSSISQHTEGQSHGHAPSPR